MFDDEKKVLTLDSSEQQLMVRSLYELRNAQSDRCPNQEGKAANGP